MCVGCCCTVLTAPATSPVQRFTRCLQLCTSPTPRDQQWHNCAMTQRDSPQLMSLIETLQVVFCNCVQPCGSIEEAAALVTMAKASRAVGETRANARSSRSHLIVRIKVEVLQLSSMAGGPPSPVSSSRASAAAGKGGRAPPATVSFSMVSRWALRVEE